METVQKRPAPFGRLLTVALAGAALIAALGLLVAIDTFELPIVGDNESTTGAREDVPTWNPPTDRMPGASLFSGVGDTSSDQVTTKADHRHQMYVAEEYQFDGILARPQGIHPIMGEPSNSQIFFTEFEPAGEDGGSHRENSRIGLTAD